ncbi:hypothetical protein V8C86DRAFT_205673 [Haematococcus lacustris]
MRIKSGGVSLKWLLSFVAELPSEAEQSTEEVVAQHILPLVADTPGGRLLDLVPDVHVGIPRMFVIHAWKACFQELIAGLTWYATSQQLDRSTTFVWLDVACTCLSVNQLTGRDMTVLKEVMAGCSTALLCVDSQALVLTRYWCLFEAWLARSLRAGKPGQAGSMGAQAMVAVNNERLRPVLFAADVGSLRLALSCLSLASLSCSQLDDLELLQATLAELGVDPEDGSWLQEVLDSLVGGASQAMTGAEKTRASGPQRYLEAMTLHAVLLAALAHDWEAEKAMRQALRFADDHPGMMSSYELGLCNALLAEALTRRGFAEEGLALAHKAVTLCAATDGPAPGLSLARTVAALRLPSFRMAKSLARLMSSRSRKGPRQVEGLVAVAARQGSRMLGGLGLAKAEEHEAPMAVLMVLGEAAFQCQDSSAATAAFQQVLDMAQDAMETGSGGQHSMCNALMRLCDLDEAANDMRDNSC